MSTFEFDDDAVLAAELAAIEVFTRGGTEEDIAHAVITALEPFVEKHAQFVRRAVLTGQERNGL